MKLQHYSICEAVHAGQYERAAFEILRCFGIDLPDTTTLYSGRIIQDWRDDARCARIWVGHDVYEWSESGWFYPTIPLRHIPAHSHIQRITATFWIPE